MDDSQRIDLAVAGKFHAFSLASEYAALGRLGDLYCVHRKTNPPSRVERASYHNRFDLAVWAALSRFGPAGYTDARKMEMFDNWLLRRLAKKTPAILHSWNGNSRNTFRKLKGAGWRLCVERSCPHNQFQHNLLVEEGESIGIPHRQDMRVLEWAIEELHLADVIVAPSSYSARSYTEPELIRKVRVNPLGANVRYVERSAKTPGLKVLMVGNAFLRKGTHYLVEAFKLIDDAAAELWIRGDVPDAYRSRIRDPRVKIIPPVLPDRLRQLYEAADVFVQPSIDEGFGMTVFEALGYGLPLVVTENVGARDVLKPDVAVTVPIRDPFAIAAAIETARRLPGPDFDETRRSIIEKNSWRACAQRMIDTVYAP
jgi:glycosyltransferase involved in cell wall biosynthesis